MARVLNVNDRTAARYVVTRMLEKVGFEVVEAETGREALERAAEQPDVIVLDVKLPDLNGYEVSRRLKENEATASIPVVMTSAAFTGSDHRVEGLDSGADAYLAQPFEPEELFATLRALLRVRAAERKAIDALRIRDDFLSTAAHELRTPVTALMLQSRSLQSQLRSGRLNELTPDKLDSKLALVVRQANHLARLVNGLMDVSRLNAGRLVLEPEEVDLSSVARQVIDVLRIDLKTYGSPIEVHAPEPVMGLWDRLRMEQVMANLITNACRYGCGSPVNVCVSSEPNNMAVVSVADRGVGISAEDQARIFERFERVSSAPTQPGLGLGLWITRQIVTASGGTISVASTPGEGATFTVRLKRHAA